MAERHADDDSRIDYTNLFVYAGPEQPDMSDMTIYDHSDQWLGLPGGGWLDDVALQANIIGSSHYMTTAGFPKQYREITSCKPITMARGFEPVVHEYDITRGIDDTLIRHLNGYRVEIHIDTIDHDEVDVSDWDMVYTFDGDGPKAPTAIDMNRYGWETIHAYPEFDVDVWTETEFFNVG